LESIGVSAEKADILFIHVHIQKAPRLSGLIAEMRLQVRKLVVEYRKQFWQVVGCTSDVRRARRQAPERSWDLDSDTHLDLHR
jgi:hypothetical protein